MTFLRSVLVVLGSWCLLAPLQAQTSEMHFRHLAMQWPAGYTVLRAGEPMLLRGPRGQEVAASVHLASFAERGSRARTEQRRFTRRSTRLLQSAAASHGRLVHTANAALPDGSTLVAVASQTRRSGHYLLQFGVIAESGHVGLLTVQGQGGNVSAEYRRLLPLFQTARWIEDASTSAVSLLASR
jgi:hypothetical protein